LANRRSLTEGLERELARARRYDRPLSLVVFDVDGFRAIRSRLGHFGGDNTLRSLASALRPMVRKDELLARSGGDEFAVCLPESSAAHAAVFADRVVRAVAALPMTFEGERYQVTVSAGVGTASGGEEVSAAELIARAEEQLRDAKKKRAG
jgi:diguanylate cyclase (GGDEF)-like protein